MAEMNPRLVPPPPPGYTDKPAPPQQYLDAPDPTNPMANAMQAQAGPLTVQDLPTKYPKLGATAIASLPSDPQAKIDYLAQSLFPGASKEMATRRMGISNGRAFYIDYDGKAYYAEPSFDPMTAPMRTLATLPDQVAGAIGPGMETAAGMGAGLATAEFAGGVPGAAAGGALGNAVRQGLSYGLTGEEKPVTARLMEAGGAALGEGAGQLLGLGLAKTTGGAFNRNPLRVAGYDAGGLSSKRIAEMEAAADKARQMGVTVTPGEAGGVTSLLQRQRQLGRLPESADAINDFYTRRNTQQLPTGWDQVLREVSGVSAPGVGARNLGEAAAGTIKAAKDARSAKAGPIYEEAFAANSSLASPEINLILRTPAGKQALKDAAEIMQNDRSFMALPDPEKTALVNELVSIGKMEAPNTGVGVASGLKMRSLDYIKKALDYKYQELAAAGRLGEARPIKNLAKALRNEMDALDTTKVTTPVRGPDGRFTGETVTSKGKYAEARAAFAGDSPEVTGLEKGLVGLAAKERASGMQNIPKVLFDASSADPISIITARNAFEKAGKMDDWNAGLRSYLQNIFDTAAKQDQGPAVSLHRALKADARQYNNLKAAMTPKQFSAFEDFMSVLDMVKRAPKEGSPTATDVGSRDAFVGPGAKAASNTVRAINPINWPTAIANKIDDWSAGKNAAEMVDIITNPKAVQSLRRLRVLKPGSEKFIQELGYLGAVSGFSSMSSGPDDRSPEMVR